MLKDLLKEGGLYTIANLLTKGVSLLLIPFYTAYFTPSDYGVIDILSVFGSFFIAIVTLQLGQGLSLYVGDQTIPEKERVKFASSAIFSTIILLVLFGIIVLLNSDFLIDKLSSDVRIDQNIFYLAIYALVINGIFYILGVYLRFLRKVKVFSILSFVHAVGNIALTLVFVLVMDLGIVGIFLSSVIVTPIIVIIQFFILKDKIKWFYIGENELKKLLVFSIPLVPAAVSYALLNFTDRIFINEYLNSAELGVYGIGAKFASIVSLVLIGFSMALNPLVYEKHKDEGTKEDLAKIFTLFICIGTLGVLILSIFSYETLVLFTQPQYYDAYKVMPILYASVLTTGLWMFSPGIYLEKKTSLTALIVVTSAMINVVLNYFLITKYTLIGTAVATLISNTINYLTLFYFAQKFYRIKVDTLKLLLFSALSLFLSFVGVYKLNQFELNSLTLIGVKLLIVVFYFVLLVKTKTLNLVSIKNLFFNEKN